MIGHSSTHRPIMMSLTAGMEGRTVYLIIRGIYEHDLWRIEICGLCEQICGVKSAINTGYSDELPITTDDYEISTAYVSIGEQLID